jgi:hypothetical protein
MHPYQTDALGPDLPLKLKKTTDRQRINALAATLADTAHELSKLTHCKGVQWETAICLCHQAKKCIQKFEKEIGNET